MVPTDQPHEEDESPIYRNIHCYHENGGQLIPTFRSQPEARTVIDLFAGSAITYADEDCMGERIKNPDGTVGPYVYISYAEVFKRVLAFGRALIDLGLKRGDRVGIYSSNSMWWQITAFGAYSVGLVIVPVYDSLGPTAAEYIINQSGLRVIVTSEFKFPNSVELTSKCESIEHIVVMGEIPSDFENPGLSIQTCQQLLDKGFQSTTKNEFSGPDDLGVIMYTSGSTGKPKGCMLSQSNIVAGSTGLGNVNMSASPSDTFLSFLPLAHIYAMSVELMLYAQGGRIGFTRGQVKYLLEDIQAMQPTILIVVPRVVNKIVDGMKAKLAKQNKYLQKFINYVIADKAEKTKKNIPHSLLLDAILFKDFRAALGGRIRLIVSGGAPILPDIFTFLCATVTPNIIQGYGLSEVSAGLAVQEMPVIDPMAVGPVSIACECKLRRVEGTDYDPNPPPESGKRPAGELLVRGPILFQGYYGEPKLTEEAHLNGWFLTGDICEVTPFNQLRIIDRAKQLCKLSQGEYISLTTLTDYYSMTKDVEFIYVYGSPQHEYPVAVVVPTREKLKIWEENGIDSQSKQAHDELAANLLEVFTERKMRGFERITKFIIEPNQPTIENGLLTPSLKPQFASWKRKYEKQLLELFNN
jgi:long-chain acyl-CoA synthetase